MSYWVSPWSKDTDFKYPLSDEDQIRIFDERVRGWKLEIAEALALAVKHSGFAVLSGWPELVW